MNLPFRKLPVGNSAYLISKTGHFCFLLFSPEEADSFQREDKKGWERLGGKNCLDGKLYM